MNLPNIETLMETIRVEGNQKKAAKALGISRHQVSRILKKANTKATTERLSLVQEHKLKVENKRLKSQLKDALEDRYDSEVYQRFVEGVVDAHVDPPVWLAPSKKVKGSVTACALFSDLHYPEVVRPGEVEGCNAYDSKIAELRIKEFTDNTIRLARDYTGNVKVDGLVLPFLGDMLSGDIHEELSKANEVPTPQALINLVELTIPMLTVLRDHFGAVHVPCVPGNHPRLSKKPQAKERARNNMDWLYYQVLAMMMRDTEGVTFAISEGADCRFNICGHRFVATHGDQFRGGSGISGMLAPLMLGDHRKRKRANSIGQPYDYMLMGHWHQLALGVAGIICNGSVKGYDEYAYVNNFNYQEPEQAFFLVDPDHGVTVRAPIRCKSPQERW
ncbi:MAG: helix-turn-helix domain-containing protein [Planctomycetota bacterium]|jgi:hypothetical protein